MGDGGGALLRARSGVEEQRVKVRKTLAGEVWNIDEQRRETVWRNRKEWM